MNLLFLHGPPAAGKYTIGRELAALTGRELYHNHLVVDEVLKQHAFGSPEFVALRDRMWRDYLGRTAREKPMGMIFTFSPENSVPQAFIDWLFDGLTKSAVRLLSVELAASEAAIESRLATAQRKGFKKLTDLAFYRHLRDTGTFKTPVIPRTDLRIDTEKVAAPEAARLIAAHFGLKRS
jgi:hypothetical protein